MKVPVRTPRRGGQMRKKDDLTQLNPNKGMHKIIKKIFLCLCTRKSSFRDFRYKSKNEDTKI